MTNTKSLEQVIGDNIRRLRGSQSQSELGRKLGVILGKTWSAQVVSGAESGRRSFIAAEMVALCYVFGCSMNDLYRVDASNEVTVTDELILPGITLQMITASVSDDNLQTFLWTMLPELLHAKDRLASMAEKLNTTQTGMAQTFDMMTRITDYWTQSITSPVIPPQDATKKIEDYAQNRSDIEEKAKVDQDPRADIPDSSAW